MAARVALGMVALVLLGGIAGWYYLETVRVQMERSLAVYEPADVPAAERLVDVAQDEGASEVDGQDVIEAPESASQAQAQSGPDTRAGADPDGATEAHAPARESAAGGGADAPAGGANASGARAGGEPSTAATGKGQSVEAVADAREQRVADGDPTSRPVAPEAGADAPPGPLVETTRRSPLDDAIWRGYQAYRAGDLPAARVAYARALELAPANRDARLGAAAVALATGADGAATRHYRHILEQRPRDAHARAGLARATGRADARGRISTLKRMLRRHPDDHALRFALGNLYARDNRWSAARGAYLQASRAAPETADYIFNLAVAHDRLGQRQAARTYYRRALELAGQGTSGFDAPAARRRLQGLDP